jgi:hypothetical protein
MCIALQFNSSGYWINEVTLVILPLIVTCWVSLLFFFGRNTC